MVRNLRRPALALGLVAIAALVALLVVGVSSGPQVTAVKSHKLLGDPDRMNLKNQARPGQTRDGGLPPAAALAAQQLQDRAYPGKSVPFGWTKAAMAAFKTAQARGNDNRGTWQLAGPSTATYPQVLNRWDAPYVASGRISALAIAPTCTAGNCRVWVGAAGGGVWRTDDALAASPSWTNLTGSLGSQAVGSLVYDSASGTLYLGTGEQNESADSDRGIGIYKSTDGGTTWSLVPGSDTIAQGNAVAAMVPTAGGGLLVATTYGVAGMSGVAGGSVPSYLAPGTPTPGVYRLNADGSNALLFDASSGAWGANGLAVDSHGVIYTGSVGVGVFRSADNGATWQQIFQAASTANRTEFAIATTAGSHTRIYIGDGGPDLAHSGFYHADSIDTATAASLLTGGTNGGYAKVDTASTSSGILFRVYNSYGYCWAQCWYDNFVVSPPGQPDVVYVGGAFDYSLQGAGYTNGAAVLMSLDGGNTWADETGDANHNGLHPDQHALVVNPSNPKQFFEGSDGGLVRSSGSTVDLSATRCAFLGGTTTGFGRWCTYSNSAVPTTLTPINAGLSTLQFQNVVVNPGDATDLMGGTQDNGTWEGTSGAAAWPQTMYGDGGVAAFDKSSTSFRMNEFYQQYTDVNFRNGDPTAWVVVSAPFFASGESAAFYKPQINDPVASGTFFVGLDSVWRTTDFGGDQATLEANCPEFTAAGDKAGCGDFVPLGGPGGPGSASDLTSAAWGADKTGQYVVAISRAPRDAGTLWAATRRGRVFVTKNANASDASTVSFSRIDAGANLAAGSAATPRRFVAGIAIDPTNANHAYVAFGGYNNATDGVTPATPGHVFDVTYDPITHKAMWTVLDNSNGALGDMPINSIVLDSLTNRLYVATDFGVLTQVVGKSGQWKPAAGGLPTVAVSGLTLDSAHRMLYAATHGRAIWSLSLGTK
jgi:hypothetical protein